MSLLDALSNWMPRQRWFAGKSHRPRLRLLGEIATDAHTISYYVMDDAGERPTLYHVPVVVADGPPADPAAVIGLVDDRVLVDAPHDPGFALRFLQRLGLDAARVTSISVLTGEQSNTSIVYREHDEPTVIAKLFRTLHHGENPDVTLQAALSRAGSPFVPAFLGSVDGSWPDSGRRGGVACGTLGFAQEFLPWARDGWTVALEAAREGRSFDDAARDLGAATAGVHRVLAEVMPTRPAAERAVGAIAAAWSRRLRIAAAEVPAVAERRAEIRAVYRAARHVTWPRLQRVHGDLHLGQVLAVPDRGWRLVDFEGEPLRPMPERTQADVAIRDVAGMLRSFAYAAGASGEDRREWAAACRDRFLEGYESELPGAVAAQAVLLEAFELDKAVYETVYEARNRPDWAGIPLAGIDDLLARRSATNPSIPGASRG